jgi:hypothetical protein
VTGTLLALSALVYLLPEHLPGLLGGTQGAWEVVAYGIEAAILWALAGLLLPRAAWVCAWACCEALQRAACRLALPMDRAPKLADGQTMCEAATGLPMGWVSLAAAAGVSWAVARRARGG